MSAPPQIRQSRAEETYLLIRAALVRGEYAPAQHLSEPELALRFKTSRSPVREALVRLEHEGFLECAANGRTTVKPLDVADLRQLYVVRASLEGLAARLATPLLRTIDLEAMSKAVDEMEGCVKTGDASGALKAGEAFHDVIMRECGNKPLTESLNGFTARISRYRAIVAALGDYDKERVAEHRRILKALYNRNAEAAEIEVVRHVNRSAEMLIRKLERTEKHSPLGAHVDRVR
jgi:DNA-binding GntR family transcriptional regulator